MINSSGLFYLFYAILLIISNCYQSYEATGIIANLFKKPNGFWSNGKYKSNNLTCYNNLLQNRLLNLQVTSSSSSRHGIAEEKSAQNFKRSEVPLEENKNLTASFWENLNALWQNPQKLKNIQDFKSSVFLDKNPYQAIQNNYVTIPQKTFELLQSDNMCPKRNTKIHPCKTIFRRTRLPNTVWPREIITASCQCNGQRCSVMGIDTCVTLVSKLTVINFKGMIAGEYVPVACVCMALKGISAKEIIPLIV